MKVFDIVPNRFFSILLGKNQNVYIETLMVIRKAFKQEIYIEKASLINMLVECFTDLTVPLDIAAEMEELESDLSDLDLNEPQSITYSAIAHLIIRRLRNTGWIETEYKQRSYDEIITLPPYSVSMIEFLYSITQDDTKAYKAYAFNTYSALKTVTGDDSQDYVFTALEAAYDNCNLLTDSLKILLNNIRRYHQILNNAITANDILRDHFEGYQIMVNERIFHPLVTKDSVQRFKIPVMTMIDQIRSNVELREKIVSLGLKEKRYLNHESGMEDVIQKLYEIFDTFEGVDLLMQEIQIKNTAYTKASIDKMIYLLNHDRSIKAKMADLLMRYFAFNEDQKKIVSSAIKLFQQNYIDEKSLYARSGRRVRSTETPFNIQPGNEIEQEKDLDEFLLSARNTYSHQRVIQHMHKMFGDKKVLHSEDINVNNEESFILLILASMKTGEKRTFYDVEFLEGYIEKNSYRYPHIIFIRKGEGYNDKPLD